MVGIPGKSKGCHTCRRRKIKCDLAAPNCERCSKRGLICEGYERGPVFINRTTKGIVRRRPLEEAQSRNDAELQMAGSDTVANGSMIDTSPFAGIDTVVQRLGTQINGSYVMLKRIRSLFEEQYLPNAPKPKHPGQGTEMPGLWLLKCINLPQPGQALEYSSTALALSRVGKAIDNTDLVLRGRLFYGHALRELQKALLDPLLVVKDDTLAACQTLAHYEFLESPENPVNDHSRHLSGIVKLLKHRRPVLPETELGIALVNYIRFTSMVLCVQQRSMSLFGSLKEKDEMWRKPNTVEQKVYDKGYILADILGHIDRAASETGSVQNLQILLEQCFQLDIELEILFEEILDFEAWKDSQLSLLNQLGDQSQEELTFPDICVAHLTLVLWGIRIGTKITTILLYQRLPQMEGLLATGDHFNHVSSSLYHSRVASSQAGSGNSQCTFTSRTKSAVVASGLCLASYVLRAVPYCIRDEMGLCSTMRSIFSLRVALGMFRLSSPSSERLKMAEELVAKIAAKDIPFAIAISKHSGRWGDTKQ